MDKRNMGKILIGAFFLLVFLSRSPQAQAREWRENRHHHGHYYVHHPYPAYGRVFVGEPDGFVTVAIGGSRYYYCDGVYYRRIVDDYVVVPTPIGTVITALPVGCQTVVIGGSTYYTSSGVYYRYTPYGYEVVPEPRVVVIPPQASYANYTSAAPSGEKFGISDIIVLSKAGLNDDVIIEKILTTGAVFHLSAEEVEALRKEGVSSRVVNFMLNRR